MNDDLIEALWSQALREGDGVTGVGRRMAQLVAEECAKLADGYAGDYCLGNCARAIREKFCSPTV